MFHFLRKPSSLFLVLTTKKLESLFFVTLETTNMRNSYGIFHKHFKAELNKSLISVAHTYPFENFLEFFLWFPTYNRIFTRLKNECTRKGLQKPTVKKKNNNKIKWWLTFSSYLNYLRCHKIHPTIILRLLTDAKNKPWTRSDHQTSAHNQHNSCGYLV